MRNFILTVLVIFMVFGSCKSSPAGKSDVWTMLSKDDSRAKEYFLGEVDVHATDPDGRTPLHYAAEKNNAALASFFIAMGADSNAQDNSGKQCFICIRYENGKGGEGPWGSLVSSFIP